MRESRSEASRVNEKETLSPEAETGGQRPSKATEKKCPTLCAHCAGMGHTVLLASKAICDCRSYFKLVLFSSCSTMLALPMPTFVLVA